MRINTRLAQRLNKINASSTLAITSKAKKLKSEGKAVINFAAGEPDFDTPQEIKAFAIEAINSGFTKYTPSTGTLELKEAISGKFKKDNNLDYGPSQIVVSCGAKHSIFNTLFVTVNPGDEVLIPSPFWVSYPEIVNLCQGIPKFIKTSLENSFKAHIQDLEKHLSAKTKVLILNSPCNPTGAVYTKNELKDIADLCVKKNILVISDEIYEKITYDNLTHYSIASFNKDIYNLTVTINGLSKSHSMTGWRIGYLGGPADIVEAISRLQDHTTSNPASISQKAALKALSLPQESTKNMAVEFEKRRNYILKRLANNKIISFCRPQGAFYIFCDISKSKMDSGTFSSRLLDETLVAVIPGESFGRDDYIRMSFATSSKDIEEGINRIENWLTNI
ncbi:MAG: pyridoxal phosphate-dependent aminotransferase [Candidatus Omnitrophota bacterium]